MNPDDPRVRALAAAIADGQPVDWRAESSLVHSSEDRALVEQLRLLSHLADLHRPWAGHASSDACDGDASVASRPLRAWAHLELREELGAGSCGIVYRAWDPQLAREVALKLLPPRDAGNDALERSMLEEARRLARVKHANVIAVYGADTRNGRAGFWMELIEGRTLRQRLEDDGVLDGREAALIGIDVCRALAAVHGAGLVHRDVKAQNVMREAGGRIVLMDFGTGMDPTRARAPAGTPLYMAPEVLEGGTASPHSDVYSIGVLLFHLVTGEFPVAGRTVDELLETHRAHRRRRLRDLRPDLPGPFVHVIDTVLAEDPERRPATAGTLEAALVDCLDSWRRGAAEHVAVPNGTSAPRTPRRRLLLAAIAAGVLAWGLWALGGASWLPFLSSR